ncbi:MAG: carbohydrate ABC transporter permease [Ruminococcaceae bacterium]|nr:carbohydrate ABC transporter permease [Oscillospiraceae bacterium]
MTIKRGIGSKIFDTFNVIILSVLSLVALYPFLYVLFVSFSNAQELTAYSGIVYKPVGFSLAAYKAVFENRDIYVGYMNTLFYVGVGTIVNIIMTCIAAYGISRKNFYWKKALTTMIVITMFFGGGLIPHFLVIKNLGLLNSRWVLILPTAISTYNLMILKTTFQNMPDSIEEAAKIDGANDFVILFKILFPLALPTIAVVTLYYAVGHWNSWFNAMIYITDRDKFPLQLFLREILISNNTDQMMQDTVTADKEQISETIQYATIIVSTIPILFLYPFLQKYFVKGIMVGAVKG